MSKLREIAGLNKYEEMVYLSLVKIGLSTSSIISKESQVPYGRIYSILSSLEDKGFVKVYSGNPKKFMAIEPRIIFDNLMEKKSKELKEDKKELNILLENIESTRKTKPTEPKEAVHVIEGLKNYLNLSVRLHEKAKKEWRAIHGFPIYQPHLTAYKKMVKRGIVTKIIAPVERKNTEKHKIWKRIGAKIKFSSKIISRYSIIDDTDVILRIRDLTSGSYTAIWIESPALAKTLISNFEKIWKTSR